jgi:hypothetical protein
MLVPCSCAGLSSPACSCQHATYEVHWLRYHTTVGWYDYLARMLRVLYTKESLGSSLLSLLGPCTATSHMLCIGFSDIIRPVLLWLSHHTIIASTSGLNAGLHVRCIGIGAAHVLQASRICPMGPGEGGGAAARTCMPAAAAAWERFVPAKLGISLRFFICGVPCSAVCHPIFHIWRFNRVSASHLCSSWLCAVLGADAHVRMLQF